MPPWRPVEWLAYGLYQLVWALGAPMYVARLWWRGRREAAYRLHLGERFGWVTVRPRAVDEPGWIWIHAVSLGEARAAQALVDELRARLPGCRLWLTHSTATGLAAGQALLRPGDGQSWFPMDGCGAPGRFLKALRPSVGILMETEVWPGVQQAAAAAGIPLVLASARLSERSLRKGRRASVLLGPAVRSIRRVLAQTPEDAQRLSDLGAGDVRVCGNLKFDVRPSPPLCERGRDWRHQLARPVVLMASSREGEEAMLLAEWTRPQRMAERQSLPGGPPLLLIVPRHPQRFDDVATCIQGNGLTMWRRSLFQAQTGESPRLPEQALKADVWLGDSLGEMPMYYSMADLGLLGGSFQPFGGQNLIEAAACGCPLLMGPHTFNFQEAAAHSQAEGAARMVSNLSEALTLAHRLLPDPEAADDSEPADLSRMREGALRFYRRHRGAAARTVDALLEMPGVISAERFSAGPGR